MNFTRQAMAQAIASAPWASGYIELSGGLDTETKPYERKPGTLRNSQNFEARINGGYGRVMGYERTDGRAKPSDAEYTILAATLTGGATGNTVTGVPSGATGVIIALPGGSLVMTKVVGTFANGDDLQVSAVSIGTATGDPLPNSASTPLLNAQYLNLAADQYRADIGMPTGSGKMLGGFYLRSTDTNYCFRNNAGGTAAGLWKSSASGWTAVTLFNEVSFTAGGLTAPAEGSTLTQGANTATIKRVVLTSGAWASGNAAGRLIVTTPAPGNFAAGAATVGAINLTLSGVQTAITLSPSGRYECIHENFGGSVNTTRVYGCDGVNRAFEFGDDILVPITTGAPTDTPTHIASQKNRLWLSFGGSVQYSTASAPYIWSYITGANELAMGDTVTGFAVQPGTNATGAMAVFTRNRMSIMYGASSSDFNLVAYRDELGAHEHTLQDIGYSLFLDDRGVTDIQTSQEYGNFVTGTITDKALSKIQEWKPYAVSSCVSREKSQYRLHFTNGYGLYFTFKGKKVVGIMPVLFPDVVRCTWTAEDSTGNEVMFFGSDDGYVYQMEKGTSFDGDNIEFILELSHNFFNSPRVDKSFHSATVEVSGNGYAEFNFSAVLGYGSTSVEQPEQTSVTTSFAATNWDSVSWDSFSWDGVTLTPSVVAMTGMAENCGIVIRGDSDYFAAFDLTGIIVHHTQRRQLRA